MDKMGLHYSGFERPIEEDIPNSPITKLHPSQSLPMYERWCEMRIDEDQVILVKRIAICNTEWWRPDRQYWNEKWKMWTTLEHATLFTDVDASDQTDLGNSWHRCVIRADSTSVATGDKR